MLWALLHSFFYLSQTGFSILKTCPLYGHPLEYNQHDEKKKYSVLFFLCFIISRLLSAVCFVLCCRLSFSVYLDFCYQIAFQSLQICCESCSLFCVCCILWSEFVAVIMGIERILSFSPIIWILNICIFARWNNSSSCLRKIAYFTTDSIQL